MPRLDISGFGPRVRVRLLPWWVKPLVVIGLLLTLLLAVVVVIVAVPVALVGGAAYLAWRTVKRALLPAGPVPAMGGPSAGPEVLDADDPARQNVRVRRADGEGT